MGTICLSKQYVERICLGELCMHTFVRTFNKFHNTFAGIRLSELVPDKIRQCYVKMFGHLREVCATY